MNIVVYILAGGVGGRLSPLTLLRSKPSVPFGGMYRLIDFTLTNCIRSDLRRIYLLTQYRSESLQHHLNTGWNIFNHHMGEFLTTLPPQMRSGQRWYAGTADAIFHNLYQLERDRPEHVLILSGDHIYRMDYRHFVQFHVEKDADVSIVTTPVEKADATRLGVVEVDSSGRINTFHEKIQSPPVMPNQPGMCLSSMGIYLFKTDTLAQILSEDSRNPESSHDFGKDIFPPRLNHYRFFAHYFPNACPDPHPFWMDVGTIDSYYDVSMGLLSGKGFPLRNDHWPVHTYSPPHPPTQFFQVHVEQSLISPGCVLDSCDIRHSIISPDVTIGKGSLVENSIIMEGVSIGADVKIADSIIDKHAVIPDNLQLGFDDGQDRKVVFLTDKGIRVVKRGVNLGRILTAP